MREPEGLEEADQAPDGASASESHLFPSCKGCKEPQKRETRNQGCSLSFLPTGYVSLARHLPSLGPGVSLDYSGQVRSPSGPDIMDWMVPFPTIPATATLCVPAPFRAD